MVALEPMLVPLETRCHYTCWAFIYYILYIDPPCSATKDDLRSDQWLVTLHIVDEGWISRRAGNVILYEQSIHIGGCVRDKVKFSLISFPIIWLVRKDNHFSFWLIVHVQRENIDIHCENVKKNLPLEFAGKQNITITWRYIMS